jgi:glycosyltransferase involved in cell wall biosynthesis
LSERLHVALDARIPPRPSGVGIYTHELIEALAGRNRLRMTAVVHPSQSIPWNVERLETEVAFDAHGLAEWFEHVVLPRQLAKRRVEVFHSPNTMVPMGRVPFARVATVHDVAFHRFGKTLTPLFRMLMRVRTRRALQMSDAVLAVSRFTADELVELYPDQAAKVVAIPSGTPEETRRHQVDLQRAEPLLHRLGLIQGCYVCAIGTLEPRKNLVMLLEAFKRADVEGLKIALIGDRGWRDRPLKEALSTMPSGTVVLTGWLDGPLVHDLLGLSAGLLYPSLYEGFGFPPLEGLALGVPVICADLPPIRASCGDQAIFVGACDLDGWIAALRRLPALGGRSAWVGRTFSEVAEQTEQLYYRVHKR